MPAKSKSQQRLFGMVHAFQKGKIQTAPAKIKDVAKHISPTDATHFAATKLKGLPKKVKKAGWYETMRKDINKVNGHYSPEEFKSMTGINTKEAFARGFFKAAVDSGVDPITTIQLMKQANSVMNWLQGAIPPNPTQVAQDTGQLQALKVQAGSNALTGGLEGGLGGAALGGAAGYFAGRNKQHPQQDHSIRDMTLLGLLGGAGGAAGLGGYNLNKGIHDVSNFTAQHPDALSAGQQ